jgi:hypothetical protein
LSPEIIRGVAKNVSTYQRPSAPLQEPTDFGVFVVNRQEFKVLSQVGITRQELYDIGSNYYMAYPQISAKCLARAKDSRTWYLQVTSINWNNVRVEVERRYLEKGGKSGGFVAADFYPHITLGQTGGQSMEEKVIGRDGQSECVAEVKLVGPMF